MAPAELLRHNQSLLPFRQRYSHIIHAIDRSMPKREESTPPSTSSESRPPQKRRKVNSRSGSDGCLKGLNVHVLSPKLTAEKIGGLLAFLETNGAKVVNNPGKADVIVSGTTMKQRFIRHVDWETAVSRIPQSSVNNAF